MGHLRQIILIHTHLEGVVELLLDADANICGSNATGKTTLQRLIPVFYGELPNRVVPRTRKSFHEFYLPHQNSYLIYEYVRESGDAAMVVLTRHNQGGVEYRFAKSAYQPEFFLEQTDEGPRGVGYQEFTTRFRQAGVDYSAKLEATSEYRSVIQNDFTQLRGRHRENQRLYQMAAQYSLAGSQHRLRHIEKLVSAVHAKEGKMDTLKTMLAAIFEEDGVALPVTRLRSQEARRWISKMRQSMRLSHLNELFSQCKTLASELAHSESSLHQLTPVLKEDASQQQRHHADAAEKVQHLQRELDALKASYQEERESILGKKLDNEQALENIKRELDDIQQRYDAFLDKDMDALALQMEELPSWRADLTQQAEHLALLKAEYGHKEQEFQQHKTAIVENLSQQRQQAAKRKDAIQHDLDKIKEEFQTLRENEQNRYQTRREEVQHNFSQQDAQLKQSITEVLTQLRGNLYTPAEWESQQEAQLRVERNHQASVDAQRHVQARITQHQKIKAEHQTALNAHSKQSQQLAEKERQLHRLQRQFNPDSGTLRHFLRGEMPGWEQHLGKLIREDVLERTDLAPQLGGDPNSFGGLQLDVSGLAAPDFALDEQALLAALELAKSDVQSAQAEQEKLSQTAQRIEQQVRLAAEQVAEAEHQAEQAEQEVLFATQARDLLREELNTKIKQRRSELSQQQSALEERQALLAEEREARLQELKQDFEQKRLELQADSQDNIQREEERLAAVDARLKQQEEDAQTALDELAASFHAELEQQGVNTQVIKTAEERLRSLEQRIRDTESRRDELADYQHFMRVRWTQKPTLVARETELQALVLEGNTQLNNAKHGFETARQKLEQQHQRWREQQATSQQFLDALTPLLEQLKRLPQVREHLQEVALGELGAQAERIERGRHLLEQRAKQEQKLRQALSHFDGELTQGADENFRESLHQERLRLQQQHQADTHILHELAPYEGMLKLLRDEQTQLLQQGRNMGGDLNKFFTVFRDLNRRIHAQSRRLSEEVAHEMHLDGISRAEVKIESTIDQLDFWEPLKRFSDLHHDWEHSGEAIPSEEYLNALGEVAELLRQDQQYRFENLLQLELHLTEGGHNLVIRNDRQLLESSSHGMAYLILCQFLLAFTRLLRGSAQVKIHWPIDEIGTLAYANVEQLFRACAANNIVILGAFPNPESDVLGLFTHRYLIEKEANSEVRRLKRIEPHISPLAAKLQAQREALQ